MAAARSRGIEVPSPALDRARAQARARMPPSEVPLQDKVRFLRRPDSYPERPHAVEAIETHMSWVFLTPSHAYKLKKPVRFPFLDYGTIEARCANCMAEVRLNRRFAPGIYLGVVPLNVDRSGHLRLDGEGVPCDWLVKMVRLPAERTLEAQIAAGAVDEAKLRQAIRRLVEIYRDAPEAGLTAKAYRSRFERDVEENLEALTDPVFDLSSDLPGIVSAAQRRFLAGKAGLLDARVDAGHIVEGHGDLRPDHVYLCDPPVIMDCLEFDRDLRLVDPVDELAYLAIECHRLGAPHLGKVVLETYEAETGDRPPDVLVDFYASIRAMLRAKLALWHLKDEHRPDAAKWRTRTTRYLSIAADHAARLD